MPWSDGSFDEEVRRFDVTVEDAVLMGMVEGCGRLDAEICDGSKEGGAATGAQCGQRRLDGIA